MKASSLLLREKTVLEVINFIVTLFQIPVGGRGTPLSKWQGWQRPQWLPLEFLWYLLGALVDYYFCTQLNHLRGCLHDTLVWVHSGSLSWLCICLHDTTTKCNASASHPGMSSLYRGKNFTLVQDLATVSCKHETSTRFGVKIGLPVDWNRWCVCNVCDFESHVRFINMKCTFK